MANKPGKINHSRSLETFRFQITDREKEQLDLASIGADSAVPGLNRNIAYMIKQVLPSVELVDKFDKHVSMFSIRMHQCDIESCTFAALRDALLPKLISGELRVLDAERIAGRHT